MDEIDRAQIEIEREQALIHARAKAHAGMFALHCVECGVGLPEYRRQFGVCIDCAREREIRALQRR